MPSIAEVELARPRSLPVFILADTSQSMEGAKIEALNSALEEMRTSFADVAGARSDIELSVIGFGGTEARMLAPLTPAAELVLPILIASGRTPMGCAFELVREQVEDEHIVPRRAYTPTLVLVSDGLPTDLPEDIRTAAQNRTATREDFATWPALQALHGSPKTSRAMRLAIGVGGDANHEMLHAFVRTPGTPVIRASDARTIEKFIQWVTLSVASRSVSANPNAAFLAAMSAFDRDEIVS